MTKPEEVAEKIAKIAAETLTPLDRQMVANKWPPEFRAIVWNAVAHHATILANEQEAGQK